MNLLRIKLSDSWNALSVSSQKHVSWQRNTIQAIYIIVSKSEFRCSVHEASAPFFSKSMISSSKKRSGRTLLFQICTHYFRTIKIGNTIKRGDTHVIVMLQIQLNSLSLFGPSRINTSWVYENKLQKIARDFVIEEAYWRSKSCPPLVDRPWKQTSMSIK